MLVFSWLAILSSGTVVLSNIWLCSLHLVPSLQNLDARHSVQSIPRSGVGRTSHKTVLAGIKCASIS